MKDAVERLLRPELFFAISGNGELTIKETDRSAVLKELTIKRVPDGAVAFELDHKPNADLKRSLKNAFSQLSCLVHAGHQKANKKCDFVIFAPSENGTRVVLGDLKSLSPRYASCAAQMRNSQLYVEYLISMLEEYHDCHLLPEFTKVIFYVENPINAKAPAQQKNARSPLTRDGVQYCPVTLGGRNNAKAIFSYPKI